MRFVFALIFVLGQAVRGQEQVIVRVGDANGGRPLPYASVLINGTHTGTITNLDGWFALQLRDPAGTLVISYVGCKTSRRTTPSS